MSELLGFELPGMDSAGPELGTLPFDEHAEDGRLTNAEEDGAPPEAAAGDAGEADIEADNETGTEKESIH